MKHSSSRMTGVEKTEPYERKVYAVKVKRGRKDERTEIKVTMFD